MGPQTRRAFSNTLAAQSKVCVVGGAGGIGQPLSLLLKQNSLVSHVAVFDMVGAPGVAADLSHITTPAKVTGHGMSLTEFKGDGDGNGKVEDQAAFQAAAFDDALQGCDVVVIPAGVPRKPGMTRQDLFEVNASLNKSFAQAVAKNCPKALVAIISNPVNSTVPIFAEQMKIEGCYDKNRVFGVTTLDIVRANTFVAEAAGLDVNEMSIPVVGGHAGASILPLLSRSTPECLSKLSPSHTGSRTEAPRSCRPRQAPALPHSQWPRLVQTSPSPWSEPSKARPALCSVHTSRARRSPNAHGSRPRLSSARTGSRRTSASVRSTSSRRPSSQRQSPSLSLQSPKVSTS